MPKNHNPGSLAPVGMDHDRAPEANHERRRPGRFALP
jgi:hypothetical protein